MLGAFNGMPVFTDQTLVNAIEDWSGVRAPSRARRRRKYGHPQNIQIRHVPKPDVYVFNGTIIGHPETIKEMFRRANERVGS